MTDVTTDFRRFSDTAFVGYAALHIAYQASCIVDYVTSSFSTSASVLEFTDP